MQMRFRQAVEGVAQKQAWIARKRIGHDAFTLDDAGIAEAGFLAGTAAIDEHHALAALLQIERRRYANHAGAQHDHIASSHETLALPPLVDRRQQPPARLAAGASPAYRAKRGPTATPKRAPGRC